MRRYRFCAKCGKENDRTRGRVCSNCLGTSGLYFHCAVGGRAWPRGEERDWVCWSHLSSAGNPDSVECVMTDPRSSAA